MLINLRRAAGFAVLLTISVFAGCAKTPAPSAQLATEVGRAYHVAEVVVSVPADGRVSWGDADREYVAALAPPPPADGSIVTGSLARRTAVNTPAALDDARSLAEGAFSPTGRSYVHAKAAAAVKTGLAHAVGATLQGERPARLRVDIKTLTIVSESQKSFLGSANILETEVWLEDPSTGRPLTPRVKRKADIATGGPFAGTILNGSGAVIAGDPAAELSARHAREVGAWLSPVKVAAAAP